MTTSGPDEPAFPSGASMDDDTRIPSRDVTDDVRHDDGPELGDATAETTAAASAEALARLVAADPAATAPSPDLAALRTRVDAALADERAATRAAVDGEEDEAAQSVPASAPSGAGRPRRTGRVLLAAAASVALLAGVAVAGVAVGRASSSSSSTTAAASLAYAIPTVGVVPGAVAAANALPGADSAAGGPAAGAPVRPAIGAPEAAPAAGGAAAADAKIAMPYYGRVILRGSSLPDEPGTATGYRFDAAAVDRQALAAKLAAAFGIDGEPVADGSGAWTVGLTDGSSASVTVGSDALASWYVSVPKNAPYYCPIATDPATGAGVAGSEGGSGSAADSGSSDGRAPDAASASAAPVPPNPCTSPTGAALPEAEAKARAERALVAAGLPVDGLQWATHSDGSITDATATLTADGRRTGMAMAFVYGPGGGLFSANGTAASLVPVPGYPVVGARTAVDRTADPRWGSLGPSPIYPEGVPVPLAAAAEGDAVAKAAGSAVAESATAAPAAPPAPPAAGPTKDGRPVLQTQVTELTATGAALDLAQFWQPDGTVLLLPAYAVTANDGSMWSVVALADDYVDFVPAAR